MQIMIHSPNLLFAGIDVEKRIKGAIQRKKWQG